MAVLLVPSQFPTIQAAVDAAQPGETIRIAPGRYTEGVIIEGKDLLRLEGAGPERSVLDGGGTITAGVTIRSDLVTVTGLAIERFRVDGILTCGNDSILLDLHLKANGASGILALQSLGLLVDRVRATENGKAGVLLVESSLASINSSHFTRNAGGGIVAQRGGFHLIRQNELVANGPVGIQLEAVQRSLLIKNKARDHAYVGIAVSLGQDHLLLANRATENQGTGIRLSGDGHILIDNRANANRVGIHLAGALRTRLIANSAEQNEREGYRLSGLATQNLLHANLALGNEGAGISLGARSTANVIRQNHLAKNTPDLLAKKDAQQTNRFLVNRCESSSPAGLCEAGRILAVPSQYRTIQAAVDRAKPGDLIRVAAGTYRESVQIPPGKERLMIQGEGQESTILTGSGEVGFSIGAELVWISGFTVRGLKGPGVLVTAEGCTLHGLHLTENGGPGLELRAEAARALVARVTATANRDHGALSLADRVELIWSQLGRNDGFGCAMGGSSSLVYRTKLNQNELGLQGAGIGHWFLANQVAQNRIVGLELHGEAHLVSGNRLSDHPYPSLLLSKESQFNLLYQNAVAGGQEGISLSSSFRNRLLQNQIGRHKSGGISLVSPLSVENLIDGNRVTGNQVGLTLAPGSSGNVIRQNDLRANAIGLSADPPADTANTFAENRCRRSLPADLCSGDSAS